MGSRLGRRVVHFANLPIKLQIPANLENIKEISLKTIPSASKIEIKRVLESLYGFAVDKVHTLNMDGKKKHRGGLLVAKPDYKKAYVSLKTPLSLSPDLFPLRLIQQEKDNLAASSKRSSNKSSLVDDRPAPSHWLDHARDDPNDRARRRRTPSKKAQERAAAAAAAAEKTRFPWTSIKSWR